MFQSNLLDSDSSLFSHQIVQFEGSQLTAETSLTLFFLLKGECLVQYHQSLQRIHAHELFFFPPNTPYGLYAEHQRAVYYQLSIHDSYFASLAPELADIRLEHFYLGCNSSDPSYCQLCRLLSCIIFSADPDKRTSALTRLTCINQLVLFLYRSFHASETAAHVDSYASQRIERILAIIREHYGDKLPLESISRELGLHPQYFSSFFQKYFHVKYTDFLNHYRVRQSLQDLIHTDKTILAIALEHGFQSHRSYSNSFEKYFHMPPSVYRQQNYSAHIHGTAAAPMEYLSALYPYYQQEAVISPQRPEQVLSIALDIKNAVPAAIDGRIRSIGIGSGYYLLQDHVYKQLKRAARECSFTHVHIRDVFCDMMNVYTEPQPDHPLYYWESLDLVLDRIIGLGFSPYIEIGYTPRELASSANMLGFGYHPYTSVPVSYEKYGELVRAFLLHILKRYGMDSVRDWRFDFWNSANLQSSNGFWDGTQKEFFSLYLCVFRVFREVSQELKLGSPNFSLPDGMDWYEAFLQMCCREQIMPDFLSIHLYSCLDDLKHFAGIFPYPPMTYNYLSLTNTKYLENILFFLKRVLEKYGCGHLPILAGEWNITYYLQDFTRDTAFMATYIVHSYLQMTGLLAGASFFCLSDVNDQTRPSGMTFSGNSGLISRHGIVKPAYYAFYLLHKLDPEILYLKPPCIITRQKEGFHVLIYNISDYRTAPQDGRLEFLSDKHRYQAFRSTDPIAFRGSFPVPFGSYSIKTYLMDQEHGSPYDAWLAMGAPAPMNDETIQALLHASFLSIHYGQQKDTDRISLEGKVKAHGILMFEVLREPE